MYVFQVDKDYEHSPDGMYQIMRLRLNGKDVTNKISQGEHFNDESCMDDLTVYLSTVFKIPADQISYEDTDEDIDEEDYS